MIAQKKIVVYTSGTFDMFHSNHLKMIKYARGLGDTLIVGVSTLDHTEIVKKLNIDVFVVGDDWTGKYDYLKELGVDVFYFPYGDGVSSTKIKEEVLKNYQDLKSKVETRVNPDVKVKE